MEKVEKLKFYLNFRFVVEAEDGRRIEELSIPGYSENTPECQFLPVDWKETVRNYVLMMFPSLTETSWMMFPSSHPTTLRVYSFAHDPGGTRNSDKWARRIVGSPGDLHPYYHQDALGELVLTSDEEKFPCYLRYASYEAYLKANRR